MMEPPFIYLYLEIDFVTVEPVTCDPAERNEQQGIY